HSKSTLFPYTTLFRSFKVMEQTITYFELLPMPTLCVINGPAMGAGLELALACDMRIGSENTKLGIPVGNSGITLNNRFAHRLVRSEEHTSKLQSRFDL